MIIQIPSLVLWGKRPPPPSCRGQDRCPKKHRERLTKASARCGPHRRQHRSTSHRQIGAPLSFSVTQEVRKSFPRLRDKSCTAKRRHYGNVGCATSLDSKRVAKR